MEENREKKLNYVRVASSVAVCVDDRGAWKVLRFRCDHEKGHETGILGALYRGGDGVAQVEEWEDDFCKREAESIMKAFREFCTSQASGF